MFVVLTAAGVTAVICWQRAVCLTGYEMRRRIAFYRLSERFTVPVYNMGICNILQHKYRYYVCPVMCCLPDPRDVDHASLRPLCRSSLTDMASRTELLMSRIHYSPGAFCYYQPTYMSLRVTM